MSEVLDVEPARTEPPEPDGPPNRSTLGRIWDLLVKYQGIVVPIVSLAVAFSVGAILIRSQGVNPTYAYTSLFKQALFTESGLKITLLKTTPLIFTGVAVSVALRVGLFNIGGQGQLAFGGLAGALVAAYWHALPAPLLIVVSLIVGTLAGAIWGSIAGLLKATRGVHEVISTIMLNYIAAQIIDYFITFPLKAPGQTLQQTKEITPGTQLPVLGAVPFGFVIAVVLAIATSWMLLRTTTGFRFNTVGRNKFAAGYAGISIPTMIVGAMVISGGLAGLAGTVEALEVMNHYESGLVGSLGFDGITVALLARTSPVGCIPAAFLIGALRAGAPSLQFETGIQPQIVDLLLAITLLLVSLPLIAQLIFRKRAAGGGALTSGWGS